MTTSSLTPACLSTSSTSPTRCRADLQRAGITRPQLFENTSTRQRFRAHDLRATFVTMALATGKNETWVSDRTGHDGHSMIEKYRRKARTWNLGELGPLFDLIPELAGTESPRSHESAGALPKSMPNGGQLGAEDALAHALARAADAGQWAVVAQLARELEAKATRAGVRAAVGGGWPLSGGDRKGRLPTTLLDAQAALHNSAPYRTR